MTIVPISIALTLISFQMPPAGAKRWETVSSPVGRFAVDMPNTAVAAAGNSQSIPGLPRKIAYSCKVDGVLYKVEKTIGGRTAAKDAIDGWLDEQVKTFSAFGGKSLTAKKITLDGHPGRDVTIEEAKPGGQGNMNMRFRLYGLDNAYLMISVISPGDKPPPQDAARFLDSLRLGGAWSAAVAINSLATPLQLPPRPTMRNRPSRGSGLAQLLEEADPERAKLAEKVHGRAAASGSRGPLTIGKWGEANDPDGDCSVTPDGDGLIIEVPGKLHDLNSEIGKTNSPRVIQEVEGDFVAEIKVAGDFKPGTEPTNPKSLPYTGAGLLLWAGDTNFVRLERAAVIRNGKVGSFVMFERRAQGKKESHNGGLPAGTAYLRLERRANQLHASTSGDGMRWDALKPFEIDMPSRVTVGLAAVNSSSEPFAARFESFTLRGASDAGLAAGAGDETPETVFVDFTIAVLTHDEATLRRLTLPCEGFEWLLKGEAAPPEAAETIRTHLLQQPIRRLKPGEKLGLPGGRTLTVGPDDVREDRVILIPEGTPIPTRLQKLDGRWRVDPAPVIAGRKAADAARKKAESAK
jgi:regulation of enolase protein 1 (concanavalin A-like superfamily)